MKSSRRSAAIGLAIVLAAVGMAGSSLMVPNASAAEMITLATLEYAPFAGKNLKFNGFVNHVIAEAFKRRGDAVQFAYLPWKRAVTETENGQVPALSYVYLTKDREKEFYLSDPISDEKIVFFHLKSNPIQDWQTLADLENYKIGATRGYPYTHEFWQAAESKQLKVDVTDSDRQNFKKLFAGRIDLFPSGLSNGYSFLRKEFPLSKLRLATYHPKPLSETTGNLALSKSRKNSARLLQVFNQGLAELKQTGSYDKFVKDLLDGKYQP
jgi:polar amino acid transport system substrate-binding protein